VSLLSPHRRSRSWAWWIASAILAASAALAAGSSSTHTAATEFTVSATVVDNCTISSRSITFGLYDPTRSAPAVAQGAIIAKCTKGDSVSVALNQGMSPGPGSTPAVPLRRMASGLQYLPYHIYLAPPPSQQEWGAGSPGRNQPAPQVAAAASAPLVFTTYGLLPPGSNVPSGQYLDIVTATVTF